jgi:formylglycine-generating enzyme required for sulfatase activity
MAPDSTETVFISYAREDEAFAQRLNTDLQQRGIATWIDELGIRGGDDWPTRIATALAGCKAVLVVVSPASMASRWVQRELSFADAEGKRILPLIHRQCEQPRWFRLRFGNVQWVDFSEGSYETNLAELLTSIEQVLTLPKAVPPSSPVPSPSPPPAPGGGTSVHIGGDVSGQVAIGSGISQVGAVRTASERQPKATCPTCGADVRPDARFCPECGKSLAAVPTPATAPKTDALTITSPIRLELVRVPAGEFLMGSDPTKDKDARDDEQPQHSVYVPEFTIAKYKVTNLQYAAFVRAMKHKLPGHWEDGRIPAGKENHPVVAISWHDTVAFCGWLSRETGRDFRLPTEAEWEKAARGTEGRVYPWGDELPTPELCNFDGNVNDITPVGRYSPQGDSPYGCADMAGNVWEWTQSLYMGYPYDPVDGREEIEAGEFIEDRRVVRGGSWHSSRERARCAFRSWSRSDLSDARYGFRCVSPVSDSGS